MEASGSVSLKRTRSELPITVHLDEVFKRSETTLTQLSEEVGMTLAYLSILTTGKSEAVRFSALESITSVLRLSAGLRAADDLMAACRAWHGSEVAG